MTKTEYIQKREAIVASMANLEGAELAAKERELDALTREFSYETALMQREAVAPKVDSKKAFRELVKAALNDKDGIVIGRSTAGVSKDILNSGDINNIASAGAVPQTIMELLPLLQNALVYDKIGIRIATGVKGDLVWPVLAAGTTVTVNGEAATVGDSTINFAKVKSTPVRLAVSTDITNEAIDNAAFDLQTVVTNNFTEALQQFLNDAVLRSTAQNDGIDGPLVHTGVKTASLSATPTYAELIAMKGKVAKGNIQMVGAAYVMNNELYALLEATPKAAGQGGMIIENGKIGAYPVFVTESIANKKVAFGCFGYAALNNHGDTRLIVDPYTKAAQGKLVLTLNSDWSLSTLRPEAFCLGTVANQ